MRRTNTVVETGVGFERRTHVVVRGAKEPKGFAFEVQLELSLRANDAKFELMLVVARIHVRRTAVHGPDGPATKAHCHGVVQFHAGTMRCRHEREDVGGAKAREPKGGPEGVGELGLRVTPARERRIGPRSRLGRRFGRGVRVGPRAHEQFSGGRSHVQHQLFDLTHALLVHQLLGFAHHGSIVPTETDEQVATETLGRVGEVPRIFGSNGHGLFDQDVRSRLEGRFGVFVVKTRRARHETDVDPGVEYFAIVLAGELEAPVRPDLLKYLRSLSGNGHEFHLFSALRQLR